MEKFDLPLIHQKYYYRNGGYSNRYQELINRGKKLSRFVVRLPAENKWLPRRLEKFSNIHTTRSLRHIYE